MMMVSLTSARHYPTHYYCTSLLLEGRQSPFVYRYGGIRYIIIYKETIWYGIATLYAVWTVLLLMNCRYVSTP